MLKLDENEEIDLIKVWESLDAEFILTCPTLAPLLITKTKDKLKAWLAWRSNWGQWEGISSV